jgi:large subunit ribosomal protein L21
MFAVVETGGKQYKVSPGQTVEVEKLPAEPGDTVELGRVLLISTDDETFVGAPLVDDAKVVARVAPLRRGPKIIVFRYKSKARYRRKTGHRQDYSVLTIEDIWANGSSLLPQKEVVEVEPEEEEAVKPSKATEKKAKKTAKADETAVTTEAAPEATTQTTSKATAKAAAAAQASASSEEEEEEVTEVRRVETRKVTTTRKMVRMEQVEGEEPKVVETIEEAPVVETTVEELPPEEQPKRGRRAPKAE